MSRGDAIRIALLASLAGLAACSREPANMVDISAVAARRAEVNIDNYAAAKAHAARAAVARRKQPRSGQQ